METSKIDFVITWVDGSDPVWYKEKQETLKRQANIPEEMVDTGTSRYRDWDILKYWFRGVEKFAPWVNQIHFVTYGHTPKWLNGKHPKLHIVKHEDFIPEKFRPTFSSHPIEWNFHRIEGLTENFVYFNDDMFLIRPSSPEDFFQKGKPVDMLALQPDVANADDPVMPYIYLNNAMLLAKYFDKRENMKRQPGAYFHLGYQPIYFGYNLLEIAFPRFTGFYTVHGPSPLKKETYRFFWEKEGELLQHVCSHPFRHKEDISQYVLREYQKLSGNFVPKNIHKFCKYFNLRPENPALVRTITKQKAKCVCINDSNFEIPYEKVKHELNDVFSVLFPEKSLFEK